MPEAPQRIQIAIVLFDDVDAQDAVGPYEVLRWLPGAEVAFVATTPGPKRSEHGKLALLADYALDDVPRPDVVIVPGGAGETPARDDRKLIAWLQQAHETSTWTASVCTGALLLGAAGVLRGKRATTHWTAIGELAQFGATAVRERYVFDGKLVSSAGVSAGIDMALALAARIAGPEAAQAIQLGIEYDPAPPFDAGSPDKCPKPIVDMVRAVARFPSARA
jgi:transcriptional regulator GlxA family with amidase domain